MPRVENQFHLQASLLLFVMFVCKLFLILENGNASVHKMHSTALVFNLVFLKGIVIMILLLNIKILFLSNIMWRKMPIFMRTVFLKSDCAFYVFSSLFF